MTVRPGASSDEVRARMQRQRRRDTQPEMAVRRALHKRGIRFRVHAVLEPDLRTRGDIVWRGRRLVVFIDSCYWHGCPVHGTAPKANAEWWRAKLETNRLRDARVEQTLGKRGWAVLRFWEHEEAEQVVARICEALENATSRATQAAAQNSS
ncbi:very short patch repair endonuclease [Micromonospora chersina]|uniref:very short patch repair endonuclease n=1 Tax=Micromonospora chersina TaxID=47854 RepID=UPI0033FBC041